MDANITNKHNAPLAIGGVLIPVGATARVPNWEQHSKKQVIKTWLDVGVIAADDKKAAKEAAAKEIEENGSGLPGLPGLPGLSTVSAEDQAKDALIEELKNLTGTERTRKTSLESLQKQVEAAKAEQQNQS